MKNNNKPLLALAIFLCVLLLIAVFIDESEMRNMKSEMQTMQETITVMQTENANLTEEYNTLKRQNVELEEQLEELQQPMIQQSYSHYDSEYDGMSAKDYIAQRESGGNYEAQNGQYYGKYQLQIDMLGGDLSPENQEETAERYVMERYGSWENAKEFWNSHGWY